MNEPLIINNFDTGIAESAHKGFALMRCLDIESFPGALIVQKAPTALFATAISGTFTAVAATDVCTSTAMESVTANSTGIAVRLTTTGTLPAGLAINTVYFVIRVNLGAGTFKLATTLANANAGTAINITDTGSGTHSIHTVNPGTVNHILRDYRSGNEFMQDSNGRVWYYGGGLTYLLVNAAIDTGTGTLTNAAGNGIVIWKQNDSASTLYLLAFRNAVVDIIDIYSTSDLETPAWSNSWQTLNSGAGSGNSHHVIVGQDEIVYFCDGRYVGSLKENIGSTFDPASAGTFTYNNQALDLPAFEIAQYIEELGVNLLIAGNNSDKIYPWNRIDDSFASPIQCPETSIKKLKNAGGLVYILAGKKGYIYSTQGSYVRTAAKLPDQVINNSGTLQSNIVTWGGIDTVNGSLIFGAGVQTSGNSGLYRLYPDGRLIMEQIPSSGSTNVTAIEATDDFYYIGYASGADTMSTSRYSNFEGVFNSGFYKVSTKTIKATYSVLEVVIAKPASTGSVRVSYRIDTSSSFTTLDTFSANGVDTTFKNDAIGLIDIENIEIQAEIDGNVELLEIRLIP